MRISKGRNKVREGEISTRLYICTRSRSRSNQDPSQRRSHLRSAKSVPVVSKGQSRDGEFYDGCAIRRTALVGVRGERRKTAATSPAQQNRAQATQTLTAFLLRVRCFSFCCTCSRRAQSAGGRLPSYMYVVALVLLPGVSRNVGPGQHGISSSIAIRQPFKSFILQESSLSLA